MVFGPYLQHVTLFAIPTTVFCVFFRHATFVCSTPGTIFGTPYPRFGPQLGRGPFSAQNRAQNKNGFVEEMVPHEVLGGSVRGEWIAWYPGGLWVRPFPPKPSQKIISSAFPDFGIGSGAALALHGGSLLSLCGPIGLYNSRWTRLGGLASTVCVRAEPHVGTLEPKDNTFIHC